MGLPWIWGFKLGFVLGAVSPAVVVPSMLLLQKDGYGLEWGVPTLLMAAGSFDDILVITGFTACLGLAFVTHAVFYFKREERSSSKALVPAAGSAVFGSNVVGFPGSGGLCTLVLAFFAGAGPGASSPFHRPDSVNFFTFLMVLCAGFNFKEKLFIALAWMPKATVQAAIGSTGHADCICPLHLYNSPYWSSAHRPVQTTLAAVTKES
ncbi:hypothetical protein MHYP_G00243150 [Metynnis hypsauchen]